MSQNPRENNCARIYFSMKLQALPVTLLKQTLWHSYFPVNFATLLRTSFFTEHLRIAASEISAFLSLDTNYLFDHSEWVIVYENIKFKNVCNLQI